MSKSRKEQEEEIKDYFRPYADPGCKLCYGTGKSSWHTELGQYIICECVMINIEKAKKEQESKIIKVEEVIN